MDKITKSNKNRVNFYLNDKVYGYIKDYANELGMNNSAFVSMCVMEYHKGSVLMNRMSQFKETIEELKSDSGVE